MTIDDLRQALERAENDGDAAGIVALMADDVVAMVPTAPVIEGRARCSDFVRDMLAELRARFDRRVAYTSGEAHQLGDHAYDRGTFAITCVSREDGGRHEVTGKYFWLLRREGERWQIARLIHAVDKAAAPFAPAAIDTERLRIARPHLADAAEIFDRYASDPEVTRYLIWPTHRTVADTEAFIAVSDAQWESRPVGPYLIRSRDDGRLLGGVGLEVQSDESIAAGYVLARDAWGRGYATEALQAMVILAHDLGFPEIVAFCHAGHTASHRVLEKCGFRIDSERVELRFPNLSERISTVRRYVRRRSDDAGG